MSADSPDPKSLVQHHWERVARDFREALAHKIAHIEQMPCEEVLALANALREAYWLEYRAQVMDAGLEGERKRADAYWESRGES
jgi:hypothetical protein